MRALPARLCILTDGVYADNTKHTGRVLTFRPDLGSVDVRARFSARSHELNVSTYAMCVLSLFDKLRDGESLRYTVSITCIRC